MRDTAPSTIDIVLPPDARSAGRPGVQVRRRRIDPPDRGYLRGVALTAAPRSALYTAITIPDGATFLDRALQSYVRFPAVYRAYCRLLGCPGSAAAGRLLIAAADGAASGAERLFLTLLRRAGVLGWTLATPFGPHLIDVAFPWHRVAIEVDGWARHVDPERFRADRRKGNALVTAGWQLLRCTWHDLTTEPGRVIRDVLTALGR